MIRSGLVWCWMEVLDVSKVTKVVELESLLDRLARHLLGVLESPYCPHHAFVGGDMGGSTRYYWENWSSDGSTFECQSGALLLHG